MTFYPFFFYFTRKCPTKWGWHLSMCRPGLWSDCGPAPVSVLWPIIQSKSSSSSWESWHLCSHLSSFMLKLQAPGEPNMWARRKVEEKGEKIFLCHDIILNNEWQNVVFFLTAVPLIRSISTVCLIVAHQVGLYAMTILTHKVCEFRTVTRLHSA